jgi:hypothetical protein
MMPDVQHTELAGLTGPQIYASAERNTKGWNYSASVTGAGSPDEAVRLLADTLKRLEAELKDHALNG